MGYNILLAAHNPDILEKLCLSIDKSYLSDQNILISTIMVAGQGAFPAYCAGLSPLPCIHISRKGYQRHMFLVYRLAGRVMVNEWSAQYFSLSYMKLVSSIYNHVPLCVFICTCFHS